VLASDVRLALATYRLQEQVDAQHSRIAALEELRLLLVRGDSGLAGNARQIAATQDSLERMKGVLEEARDRVRATLRGQIEATRKEAALNVRLLDSVKTSLGASLNSAEADALAMEQRTATTYTGIADMVERGLEQSLNQHPAFVLRDSLIVRLARAHVLHDTTAAVLNADSLLVAMALAQQQSRESDAVLARRADVGAAASQRAAAEGALVALLDEELRARAAGLVARLAHDREAADYATASAAFFKAMDASAAPAGAATPPRQ
jgi:hypothetical protein